MAQKGLSVPLQDSPPDAPPSIYVALRESPGLELKSGRGPAEMFAANPGRPFAVTQGDQA